MKAESSGVLLFYKNPILHMGLCAAPLAIAANTLWQGLQLMLAACCIFTVTVLLSQMLSKRIPYAFRILFYAVIASLAAIPVTMAAKAFFHAESALFCLPLLSCELLLTTEQDYFFGSKRLRDVLKRLLFALAGILFVILFTSILRELLGDGALGGRILFPHPPLPILRRPSGGMLLLAGECIAAEMLRRFLQGRKESVTS